ncbi:MAG: hypothetical protein K0R94_573 [Burkholderiales bacterium]|nr:hypothetical protein [Burkholderiales bacterium]
MIKKLLTAIFIICSVPVLSGCGSGNTALSYTFLQGSCPGGVNKAPYCMAVTLNNSSGGGQTWITSSSHGISNLTISTTGAQNIQTPSTSPTMDPNNCTGSTIAPGGNCTFYLKINYESFATTSNEPVNVNLNYTVNDTLFGDGNSGGSSTFTIYQVTNLYAAQSNGYVGIFNIVNPAGTNFLAESASDPINTSATDTSSYGFLYLGGNNGIYVLGNESGNESSSPSISSGVFSGAVSNLFSFSSSLYAVPSTLTSSSIWSYTFSTQTWATSSTYNLATAIVPNAYALSSGGLIYLASKNQIFICGGGSGSSTNCSPDGVSTNSGSGPGNVNAIAFPNSGSSPFTGFYVGGTNGLFAESGTASSQNNTWVAVPGITAGNSITAMTSFNSNLYAADNMGNIWYVPNTYVAGSTIPPAATLAANVSGSISAIIVDGVGGILYFATTSGGSSTVYGCNISASPSTCKPVPSSSSLYPVVSLSIASQLVSGI